MIECTAFDGWPGVRLTLVLASASPRRIELMDRLGIQFTAVTPGIDETPPSAVSPLAQARWAAREKARAVSRRMADALVLAADTVVALDGVAYGKPKDLRDAHRVLRTLSGRTHTVYTAIHAIDGASHREMAAYSRTRVTMRSLTGAQIAAYVASGEVQDKAGAYAIQAGGGKLVERIDGSYENVVGMPLHQVRRVLKAIRPEVKS